MTTVFSEEGCASDGEEVGLTALPAWAQEQRHASLWDASSRTFETCGNHAFGQNCTT
jgi:hypothetical protein